MDDAVAWAGSAWGRTVAEVRALTGAWTSTMLLLTAASGERAVLRVMTEDPWRRHAAELLTRESTVQRRLEGSSIPAPSSIALGDEKHLMTWRPGGLRLEDAGDDMMGALARTLTDIHRFDPGPDRPRDYQSWAQPGKRVVPSWARRPGLWERAFALLDQPAPSFTGVFLHRDFHLGNVLWSGAAITGVVDWVETSWGPADLNVAHAATYLAMLHGPEAATRWTYAYHAHAGTPYDRDRARYFAVMDVVGYLPGPEKVSRPWRDVPAVLARNRLEQRLEQVLRAR